MTVTAENAPAAIAEPVALVVDVAEAESGTVTLLRTADGWEIRGVHRTRTVNGKPSVFRLTTTLCDCRTNEASERRQRYHGHRTSCGRGDVLHTGGSCMCFDNYGYRPLCPKPGGHNTTCHRTHDHCKSGWHAETAEAKIRAMFAEVVKSYGRPARVLVDITDRRRPATTPDHERREYLAWLADNDPTATNPYAS